MMLTPAQLTGQCDQHITWLSERVGIHKDMLQAWQQLQNLAKIAGFDLTIASGFRNFARQRAIWDRKFQGELAVKDINNAVVDVSQLSELERIQAIMLYSALPGTSRHHWGCDIDVYAPNLLPNNAQLQLEPWEYQQNGYFHSLGLWLQKNAPTLGFAFPYDKYRQGVAMEPWHLSYMPLAEKFQQQLTLPLVSKVLAEQEIAGKEHILKNLNHLYHRFVINTGVHTREYTDE